LRLFPAVRIMGGVLKLMREEPLAAEPEMEFCLLGPLVVRRGPVEMPISIGKQRSLLAALLLNANTVVPVGQLAEALWGPDLPRSAEASLKNMVSRLRKSLGDAPRSRIVAQPGGYRIRVEPGELDINRFEALVAAALAAARSGEHAAAAEQVRAALALWRGEPLAGVPSEVLALRDVPRLEEMRLQALEARIESDLRAGHHAEVIIELRQLAAENPLRERLPALMMLALYASGQRAQALAVYQSARSLLCDELGIEPGPELRNIQRQILAGELAIPVGQAEGVPAAKATSASKEPGQPAAVVPRQLPAAVPHFAGRAVALAELAGLLDQVSAGQVVVISAIAGTAGIGKTALAVHWAHQVADRFSDGQLYVNLQGFGPSEQPMTPAEAVRLFLDGLEVAPARIPADPHAQVALYRSLLAGKRMLIVLDNARDPAQVRPLLPGSPGCLVLVTSRNQLTGLVAADGASLLTLNVLTGQEARQMLALRLAPGRIAAEPKAVGELIELCARLPLALSAAAARAAARPALRLAALVAEVRDTRARLDALGTGDAATDVRTVLSWSCQQLGVPASRMFRLLSIHPGPEITLPAAASLAGVPLPQAQQAMNDLARAHLITEPLPGRFAFHDLLRAYSAEQARRQDSDADRRAALHRVLDHYLYTACAASLLLTHRYLITLSPRQPGVVPEELADRDQALAWFQAERLVLLAVIRQASDSGLEVHAWQLPWTIATFLDWLGYWHELAATQSLALAAADHLGDRVGQIESHRYLARGRIRLGEDAEAVTHLTAAIELGAQAGDLFLQARMHLDLGGVFESQGRIRDALGHAERAGRLYRAAGHPFGEAMALSSAGWSHAQLGDYQQALDLCGQAMAIFRELDIRLGQSATLDSLGYIHHQLAQYSEAISCFQEAIDIDGSAGDRRARAEILIHLGDSYQATGNHVEARHAWQEALAILQNLQSHDTDRVRSRLSQITRDQRAADHSGLGPPGRVIELAFLAGCSIPEAKCSPERPSADPLTPARSC
jgi:DNA-binding SARP family transcriptional activator